MRPDTGPRRSRLMLVAAAVLVVFMLGASPASAAQSPPPGMTSSTNPAASDGWGSSFFPQVSLASDDASATGFAYRMDRTGNPGLAPYLFMSPLNHWSPQVGGPLFSNVFDLRGVYDTPGASPPGMAIEGRWWYHVMFGEAVGSALAFSKAQYNWSIGYDATKPTVCAGIMASPTGWQETQRRKISFVGALDPYPPGVTDVSGIAGYVITIRSAIRDAKTITVPLSMRTATVEDLGPGKSTISIVALDLAGNVGPAISCVALVDTDTPTVSIKSPAGSVAGRYFSAIASDSAGVRSVRFYVDGTLRYTATRAPWAMAYNTRSLGGGAHNVTMKATDRYGHSATASKWFTVDVTPPAITRVSATPNPFYPALTDGYADYQYVTFRVNESAKVTVTVRNQSGTVFRTIAKAQQMSPGSHSLTWNGRTSSGAVAPAGTYDYHFTATDVYGNTGSRGSISAVRYYLVTRLSPSSVKAVAH